MPHEGPNGGPMKGPTEGSLRTPELVVGQEHPSAHLSAGHLAHPGEGMKKGRGRDGDGVSTGWKEGRRSPWSINWRN